MLNIHPVQYEHEWEHQQGQKKHLHEKAIPIKRHGRKAYSIFKYGIRVIKDALLNSFYDQIQRIKFLAKLLSGT